MFQPRELPAMPAGYYKLLTQIVKSSKRKKSKDKTHIFHSLLTQHEICTKLPAEKDESLEKETH